MACNYLLILSLWYILQSDPVGTESIVNAALNGMSGVQIGNNTTLFDMTYVENAAYSHILAADKLKVDNGTSGQVCIMS